jgi:hypothetical protein
MISVRELVVLVVGELSRTVVLSRVSVLSCVVAWARSASDGAAVGISRQTRKAVSAVEARTIEDMRLRLM